MDGDPIGSVFNFWNLSNIWTVVATTSDLDSAKKPASRIDCFNHAGAFGVLLSYEQFSLLPAWGRSPATIHDAAIFLEIVSKLL
jgi:hypothetical protein